jgi:hypothetical protein
MSDHETHTEVAVAAVESPFSTNDIRGFEADDVEAGRAIGKMLSILFIYTVFAMSIVALWTASVSNN